MTSVGGGSIALTLKKVNLQVKVFQSGTKELQGAPSLFGLRVDSDVILNRFKLDSRECSRLFRQSGGLRAVCVRANNLSDIGNRWALPPRARGGVYSIS